MKKKTQSVCNGELVYKSNLWKLWKVITSEWAQVKLSLPPENQQQCPSGADQQPVSWSDCWDEPSGQSGLGCHADAVRQQRQELHHQDGEGGDGGGFEEGCWCGAVCRRGEEMSPPVKTILFCPWWRLNVFLFVRAWTCRCSKVHMRVPNLTSCSPTLPSAEMCWSWRKDREQLSAMEEWVSLNSKPASKYGFVFGLQYIEVYSW